MKKVAVVLSGNGVFDGAEIHEATLTLYSIVKNGATYEIFAPNIDQHHVINHITGEEMAEKRNVLVESARIARGKISNLADFKAFDFDALIFPGGFGVAKNLCSFAFDGTECKLNLDVEKAIRSMIELQKPIGALCIAPVLLAKILGDVKITIGQDKSTANAVKSMGANHQDTTHGEIIIDNKNKIVTTPCYMLDANIGQIGDGANNLVKAVLDLI
ncbi:MAG TPA: isoprenoid biosynthesis protein ElbB [Bacteroidales bacterium]|jgi:enhancing lycopene biosynthesis protein 2|nr:isoprenoid biosynthesis protein ElbB [Bacteroidales bacterium]